MALDPEREREGKREARLFLQRILDRVVVYLFRLALLRLEEGKGQFLSGLGFGQSIRGNESTWSWWLMRESSGR